MDESFGDNIPQISPQENKLLVAPFSESEVKEAIFQMKNNTAPGSDGFPLVFYQVFWNMLKGDLMALFEEFHRALCHFTHSTLKQLSYYLKVKMQSKFSNIDLSVC